MQPWPLAGLCAASLVLTALTYFYKKKFLCTPAMLSFLFLSLWFGRISLGELDVRLFAVLALLLWGIPVICLVAFLVDVLFAVFCLDSIIAFGAFWALCPLFFALSLVAQVYLSVVSSAG